MANEIKLSYQSGKTLYCILFNSTGQVWNTSTSLFEAYLTANVLNYVVSLAGLGSASSFYTGNFPSAIPAGTYDIIAKQQIGGSPAESDPTIGSGDGFGWNGATRVGPSDLATSGQVGQIGPLRLARGTMIRNYPFKMVSSADHLSPFTSGVISGQISRDGAAFGPLQSGLFTEIGLGWYSVQALTSGDLLANTAAVVFTGVGVSGGAADQRDFGFVLQRTSGQ